MLIRSSKIVIFRPTEQQQSDNDSQQQNDDNEDSSGNICNLDEYNRIFKPKYEIKRGINQKVISNPTASNNGPELHTPIKREISPPSTKSTAVSRPNSLPQQQQEKASYSPIVQQSREKLTPQHPPNIIIQSVPSREILNQKLSEEKKVNDNNSQFGINMNDFLPVS